MFLDDPSCRSTIGRICSHSSFVFYKTVRRTDFSSFVRRRALFSCGKNRGSAFILWHPLKVYYDDGEKKRAIKLIVAIPMTPKYGARNGEWLYVVYSLQLDRPPPLIISHAELNCVWQSATMQSVHLPTFAVPTTASWQSGPIQHWHSQEAPSFAWIEKRRNSKQTSTMDRILWGKEQKWGVGANSITLDLRKYWLKQ